MSRSLSTNAGSLDSLNCRTRCGWSPCARQMRCTELTLTPAALAIAAPVQWVASPGGVLHGQRHDPLGDRGIELRDARGPRLVAQQPIDAFSGEPLLPAPDAGLGLAGLAHDRVRADALGAQQHDLRPPDVLLRRVAVLDQSAEPIKVGRRDGNGNAGSHAADSHAASPPGIPLGIQMSDAIH